MKSLSTPMSYFVMTDFYYWKIISNKQNFAEKNDIRGLIEHRIYKEHFLQKSLWRQFLGWFLAQEIYYRA